MEGSARLQAGAGSAASGAVRCRGWVGAAVLLLLALSGPGCFGCGGADRERALRASEPPVARAPTPQPAPEVPSDAPDLSPDPAATWLYHGIRRPVGFHDPAFGREARTLGAHEMPMAYQTDFEPQGDGVFDEVDAARLRAWIEGTIPEDYAGPVSIDYEIPFRPWVRRRLDDPGRMEAASRAFEAALAVGRQTRPSAQWGIWGLPVLQEGATIEAQRDMVVRQLALIPSAQVLFPAIYDTAVGDGDGADVGSIRAFTGAVLEQAGDARPVYVFVSGRYSRRRVQLADRFIPDQEFTARVGAALEARVQRATGEPHGVDGLVLWDGMRRDPPEQVRGVSARIARQLRLLSGLRPRLARPRRPRLGLPRRPGGRPLAPPPGSPGIGAPAAP